MALDGKLKNGLGFLYFFSLHNLKKVSLHKLTGTKEGL